MLDAKLLALAGVILSAMALILALQIENMAKEEKKRLKPTRDEYIVYFFKHHRWYCFWVLVMGVFALELTTIAMTIMLYQLY